MDICHKKTTDTKTTRSSLNRQSRTIMIVVIGSKYVFMWQLRITWNFNFP